MTSFNCFVLCLAIVALFALGQCKVPPVLPCSYIAEIKHLAITEGKVSNAHYTRYNIENKGYAEVGQPMFYPDNCTRIAFPPNKMIWTVPFFGRRVCAGAPTKTNILLCFSLPPESQLVEESIVCPVHSQNLCDRWNIDISGYSINVFIRSDTSEVILDRIQQEADNWFEQMDIISFSPVTPPDSVLQVPEDQPCKIYDIDTEESSYKVSPFGTIFPNRKEEDTLINDPKNLERLRKKLGPNPTWKVGASPVFDGFTHRDFAKLLQQPHMRMFERISTRNMKKYKTNRIASKPLHVADKNSIPAYFDARDKWPLCNIGEIRNQEKCQSCWAFSAAEELADHICIATNMTKLVTLSPQYMMNCYSGHKGGCGVGYYTDLAHYDVRDIGIPLESCVPYQGRDIDCPRTCVDGSPMTMYKLRDIYDLYKPFDIDYTVRAIQTEVMTHGPVSVTFNVFEDLSNYAGGIYSRTPGSIYAGGHAVKIIGWGEENGIPYWTIVNSWGEKWGENGFFRIIRGQNDCSIEDEALSGTPAL